MTRTSIYNSLSPPPLSFFSTLLFHFLPPGSSWPHWPASLLRRAGSKVAEKQQKLTSADRQWFIANYRCLTVMISEEFVERGWTVNLLYTLKLCVCLLSPHSNLSRLFFINNIYNYEMDFKILFLCNQCYFGCRLYIRRFLLWSIVKFLVKL